MKKYEHHKVRPLAEGIGEAVFNRTYRRGTETWGDLAERVVHGNHSLDDSVPEYETEAALRLTKKGACLWAGRHLQHGDMDQKNKTLDMFSNCSTSGTSFIMFYLLLSGSGVGRLYDTDVIITDWSKLPEIHCALKKSHPDFDACSAVSIDRKDIPKKAEVWAVPDSRLGWAQVIEKLENIAYQYHNEAHYSYPHNKIYLDFSDVRERGVPIKGVQNKPAPGPKAFMETIFRINGYIQSTKASPHPLWMQAMYVDDFIAQCVLAGGSRRSSRIACKTWNDAGILDFVHIKSNGGLQTANHSVLVHKKFWDGVDNGEEFPTVLFNAITENAYANGSGEPAIINQDKLEENRVGLELMTADNIINSNIYSMTSVSKNMYEALILRASDRPYIMIVNPCGEINLHFLCGYCILFDLALYNCDDQLEVFQSGRVALKALMRANKMPALYSFEVDRTNRIGISHTGLMEYAAKHHYTNFRSLVAEGSEDVGAPASGFWRELANIRASIVADLSVHMENDANMNAPHTLFTIKPAGSVSKLYGLCEGAHLPAMRYYIRWVALTNDDPLVSEYRDLGYPIKVLKTYDNTTVVGFPTIPEICKLVNSDSQITTASEASPDEQYRWLKLLEKYWIGDSQGGQISYTLKFLQDETTYEDFRNSILEHHRDVKCCSWMFQGSVDLSAYEYLPEEPVNFDYFHAVSKKIKDNKEESGKNVDEQVDMALLECQSGYCPL
jgi:ribonucleoside-triphosphate reductase (formate)